MKMLKNQQAVIAQFDDMISVSRGKTFSAEDVRNWMRKMIM